MPANPFGAFPFPRAGCQAVFRQANGKRGGFRTVMGRVGGGGASRPHRGVSAVLFGAEQLRLLDLPQRGRAGRKSRLMMMQLLCIMGKNTRYGWGVANPADEACCPGRCSAGADGWECAACGRKDSSRFSAAAVPGGRCQGGTGSATAGCRRASQGVGV